jgi:Fur family transcriptional regulator, ferric uptake regulator
MAQSSPHSDPLTREQLSLHLKERGFRLTPQREKILDIFYTLPEGEHLSAEELHNQLKTQHSDISLATSYRTLKLLASVGVLRELDFAEDHKHYELTRDPESPHHHIICVSCGRTEEFEAPEALRLAVGIADTTGFRLTDVQLKVFGFCRDCQPGTPTAGPVA